MELWILVFLKPLDRYHNLGKDTESFYAICALLSPKKIILSFSTPAPFSPLDREKTKPKTLQNYMKRS